MRGLARSGSRLVGGGIGLDPFLSGDGGEPVESDGNGPEDADELVCPDEHGSSGAAGIIDSCTGENERAEQREQGETAFEVGAHTDSIGGMG